MFVVAVIALVCPVEDEAPRLAVDLGLTAYDVGLLLRAPPPAIVLRAEDKNRALGILAKLRERGHDAVALDTQMIVSSDAMTPVRTFHFDTDALVTVNATVEERAPYAEILALVRATHSQRSSVTETTRERQISVGRLAMSGGLLPTKVVEKTTTRSSDEREPVLYLFRRDGAPWIVRANHCRYEGLGPELRPVILENFQTFVRKLAGLAPTAVLDERLLAIRGGPDGSTAPAIDLLAHLIAIAIARSRLSERATAGARS